jgi:glycine cleavage system H protein
LKFTKTHEYINTEDSVGVIGISQHAVEQLGEIAYVELPESGKTYSRGEQFGVVESVKAISELYMPVSGTVVAVNSDLLDHPEYVNEEPYGKGWMLKVQLTVPAELAGLLTAEQYDSEVAVH